MGSCSDGKAVKVGLQSRGSGRNLGADCVDNHFIHFTFQGHKPQKEHINENISNLLITRVFFLESVSEVGLVGSTLFTAFLQWPIQN